MVLAGDRQPAGWWGEGRPASWADAVQVVREVARVLGVEVEVVQATRAPWHPGRCARLLVDGHEVGHAGELHPAVCTAYGVPARTSAVEVDLGALIDRAPATAGAPAFSTYPVAKEDVALVVDADLPAAVLAATLREGAGDAARVGAALRRLHRVADRGGQEVARLRAAVPGAGPDPHRG